MPNVIFVRELHIQLFLSNKMQLKICTFVFLCVILNVPLPVVMSLVKHCLRTFWSTRMRRGEFDCMLEKPYFKYLGFGGRKAWGELEKYKKGGI